MHHTAWGPPLPPGQPSQVLAWASGATTESLEAFRATFSSLSADGPAPLDPLPPPPPQPSTDHAEVLQQWQRDVVVSGGSEQRRQPSPSAVRAVPWTPAPEDASVEDAVEVLEVRRRRAGAGGWRLRPEPTAACAGRRGLRTPVRPQRTGRRAGAPGRQFRRGTRPRAAVVTCVSASPLPLPPPSSASAPRQPQRCVVGWLVSTACRPLRAIHCLLSAIHCLLCAIHCLLSAVVGCL